MAQARIFTIAFALVATLLPALIQGAAVPLAVSEGMQGNAMEFKFIGSLSKPTLTRGKISSATSFYFLSQNAAAYATANEDCQAFLGEDAGLVSIETQEELANLTEFIRGSDDTGSTYWVGGKYDTAKKTFVWESGVEIGPWAPWDAGHPDTRVPVTRVYASTVQDVKLRTQFSTVSTRYICELKLGNSEEEPEPCYNDNDLVIAVDSSGSIGQSNYQVALEFASRLAATWADNSNNRLAVLVYATTLDTLFGLNQNLSVSDIKDKVYNARYHNGNTNSHLALDAIVQQFQQNPRSVPHNLVFMTDGASTNSQSTLAAVQRIQAAGIRSFAVGIGSGINAAELLAIAGNDQSHVFNTDGFDDLLKLLRPVSRKVCERN